MKKKKFLQDIQEILFFEWDPIGVNQNPQCEDEYKSYASKICQLIKEGADEYKVADHLRKLQETSMGLEANEAKNQRVAKKLIALARQSVMGK